MTLQLSHLTGLGSVLRQVCVFVRKFRQLCTSEVGLTIAVEFGNTVRSETVLGLTLGTP
jgi:hypothetical protein